MENKNDFLDGDHSFKNWFSIMWQNGYIFLCIVFFTMLVFEIIYFKDCINIIIDSSNDGWFSVVMCVFAALLPITGLTIIIYKGFYQFWSDLKTGNSR